MFGALRYPTLKSVEEVAIQPNASSAAEAGMRDLSTSFSLEAPLQASSTYVNDVPSIIDTGR